jgi:cell division protein FtsN
VWFFTGMVAGVFLSFLVYLWAFVPPDLQSVDIKEIPKADPDQTVKEMQFDFYDLFPKSKVPIVEEYNEEGLLVQSPEPFVYLLQAGSFQGLEVFIREIQVEGKNWHRVMVGPFDTSLALNRAQDKLAEAEIESILLKVSP